MMLFILNLYKVYVPHSLRTADAFPIEKRRSEMRLLFAGYLSH